MKTKQSVSKAVNCQTTNSPKGQACLAWSITDEFLRHREPKENRGSAVVNNSRPVHFLTSDSQCYELE